MTSTSGTESSPSLIGIDWGSSNLRAALLDARGRLIDRRQSADGVFSVTDGAFGPALWALCGDWVAAHRVPLLACGMIGSRQGAVDLPYVPCPAGLPELAQRLGQVTLAAGSVDARLALSIVPGLKSGSDEAGWDVVRGEETQLLGVAAPAGSLHLLPGTHSKWMTLGAAGRVEGLQTYMTGELFELLRTEGSLARMMAPPAWSAEVFQQGVDEARDGALEALLFRVRTAGLMARFDASALPDYLSGLLIGAEIKAGLRRFGADARSSPISVLGAAALTRRYTLAMARFGLSAHELTGDLVFRGLLAIARAAGLIGTAAPDAGVAART